MVNKITFKNKPKLSEHEVEQKFNDRRKSLVPYVEEFISTHERFQNKDIVVTFAHVGVSSLVSIIETSKEKIVLKIPLKLKNPESEALFLKIWESAGIKVPHVIEEGNFRGEYYVLLEHINAPVLSGLYSEKEMQEKSIYLEMGKILRKMHTPRAEGYGDVILGKAQYPTFRDWIESEDVQKHVRYMKESGLLTEEHGSIDLVFEILSKHTDGAKSNYCHNDFGTSNIFATDPITVFDPSPKFNNGYIDLGHALVLRIAYDGTIQPQFISGYFQEEPVYTKVLQASIVLNSYLKAKYWHKTKKLEQIKNIQNYLLENKHLLNS